MLTNYWMADYAVKWAADNSNGYTSEWPKNQWWKDTKNNDCGSACSKWLHEALLQIGKDTGYNYYEPMGNRIPWNEEFLLRWCDRYDYNAERNKVGDILTSNGHTVMITSVDPDYITHAANDYDGVSGDSSGREVRTERLYDGGWNFIYRLKPEYIVEIGGSGTVPDKESPKDQKVTWQSKGIAEACILDIVLQKGSEYKNLVKFVQNYLSYYGWYKGLIDGDWGEMTDTAFRNWQRANKLYVDGVCGPKSWAVIIKY